jgi:hypothetical protein
MLQAERSLTIIWFSRVAAASMAGQEIAGAAARYPDGEVRSIKGAGGRSKGFGFPLAKDSAAPAGIPEDSAGGLLESPATNISPIRAIPDFGERP